MVKTLDQWRLSTRLGIGCADGAVGSNKAADRGIVYHRKVFKLLEQNPVAGMELLIEPWFKAIGQNRFRQPDAVFLDREAKTALVVEVKMNWKDGRADKLLDEYLPIVRCAFELDIVWPVLITQNLRGYSHPPLLGLQDLVEAFAWQPGMPVPLLLLP